MKNLVNMKPVSLWMGIALLLALMLSACGGGAPAATTGPTYTAPPYVADNATLPSFGFGSATEDPPAETGTAEGFVTFIGDGFAIDLPESFAEGGQTELSFGAILTNDGINLAVEKFQDSSLEAETLKSAASVIGEQLENQEGVTFLEQQSLSGDEFDLIRIMVRIDESIAGTSEPMISVSYLIKDGDTLWTTVFGIIESFLDSWIAYFDASAMTFRLTD